MFPTTATASISTLAPLGRAATWNIKIIKLKHAQKYLRKKRYNFVLSLVYKDHLSSNYYVVALSSSTAFSAGMNAKTQE